MTRAMHGYLKYHPGIYTYFVVDGNDYGCHFWEHLFTQYGYVPAYLSDIGAGSEEETEYSWKPAKE